MGKKTKKIVTWVMVILMLLGVFATLAAMFIPIS